MNGNFGGSRKSRSDLQRQRLLILGGGTLTFSLLIFGVLLIYSLEPVDAREDKQAANLADQAFGTVVVIAPSSPVPQNAKLSQVGLREIYWPRTEVPAGSLRDIEEARNMYAKVALPANQPIVRINLSATPPVNEVSELIPSGYRAVTIEVDATAGVEGWATPGAHVDVLLTYRDREEGLHRTRVAVEDAVVLSYNGRIDPREAGDTQRNSPASTVTIAVTAEDSLKVQTAKAMGRISLSLRRTDDGKAGGVVTFTSDDWDKNKRRKVSPNSRKRGLVRFRDESGKQVNLTLGPDSNWWEDVQDEDD